MGCCFCCPHPSHSPAPEQMIVTRRWQSISIWVGKTKKGDGCGERVSCPASIRSSATQRTSPRSPQSRLKRQQTSFFFFDFLHCAAPRLAGQDQDWGQGQGQGHDRTGFLRQAPPSRPEQSPLSPPSHPHAPACTRALPANGELLTAGRALSVAAQPCFARSAEPVRDLVIPRADNGFLFCLAG